MADVFISYSKTDHAEAKALAEALTAAGVEVWWDFQLYAGDDFHDVIRAEIAKAKAVIVIWSKDAVASSWVRGEAQEASDHNTLIATHVAAFDPRAVPINFRSLHCEPLANRERILAALARKGVRLQESAPAATPVAPPVVIKQAKQPQNTTVSTREHAKHDRLIAKYTAELLRNPEDVDALYNRGRCWYFKGDHDRAIVDNTEAIRINPKKAGAINNRGVSWQEKGDYGRALADYTEAIRLEPENALYHANRGELWQAQGDYDRALADYNDAIRLRPNYPSAFTARSVLHELRGDHVRAARDKAQARMLGYKAALVASAKVILQIVLIIAGIALFVGLPGAIGYTEHGWLGAIACVATSLILFISLFAGIDKLQEAGFINGFVAEWVLPPIFAVVWIASLFAILSLIPH